MANDTFHCSIVTPERAVLETEAKMVSLPAHDGEMGILRGRAPLLCQLGIGTLRVESPEGTEVFFVDRGFAQMVENKLTVLTEQARRPSEINREEVQRSLEEAQAMDLKGSEQMWDDERLMAIHRARTQIKLKDKHG